MNAVEAYKEIMRLQHIKLKNEAAVSPVELSGRYKASYEKLCENIKQTQEEYRVACTKAVRCLAEVLAEIAYMEPTDDGYGHIHDIMLAQSKVCDDDPLLVGLLGAVTEKFKEGASERVGM